MVVKKRDWLGEMDPRLRGDDDGQGDEGGQGNEGGKGGDGGLSDERG
jgi:hypothetical protein